MKAIEFFSGIGAFAQATQDLPLEIVSAFDQDSAANLTYQTNYGLQPRQLNLDSIRAGEIPQAEMWWMSPPCTPFSVRGKMRDNQDSRAASFLNLIRLIPHCLPDTILVENVLGFSGSMTRQILLEQLSVCCYMSAEIKLCPTLFGVPMRRPRHFLIASRKQRVKLCLPCAVPMQPLSEFLFCTDNDKLEVESSVLDKYRSGFDIVEPANKNSYLTCFTSGYWRCRKASGSLIALPGNRARRVSPDEIIQLLGFSPWFRFPTSMPLKDCWRLAGNSVDVRAIKYLLTSAVHSSQLTR